MSDQEDDLLLDLDDDIGPTDAADAAVDDGMDEDDVVDNDEEEDEDDDEEDEEDEEETKPVVKPVSKARLKKKEKAAAARGVIYLSRIPPYMKPAKIKHIFSQYGDVDRVYLVPEDERIWMKRKKAGGNRKRNYVEGWVEFLDKRVAKAVALALNNQPLGGKKSYYYRDDLWNIQYLSKFKWSHLSAEQAQAAATKRMRLRAELSAVRREQSAYLASVDSATIKKKITERKAARKARQAAASGKSVGSDALVLASSSSSSSSTPAAASSSSTSSSTSPGSTSKRKRAFDGKPRPARPAASSAAPASGGLDQGLLSSIFTSGRATKKART